MVEADDIVEEEEDEEDGIPWSWKYVAIVIVNPLVGGLVLTYVWGALSLHWAANKWPAWHLGVLSMIVVQLRTPAVQLLVATGLWMTLIFVFVSLCVMLPSIFLPEEEWAAAVLLVCEAFETYVLYDSVSFVSFAETEKMAQQASGHTLQFFTLSSALAPMVGGTVYIVFGWQGIACVGAGAKLVQLLVLVADETVQEQVVCLLLYLTRGKMAEDEDEDEDEELPPEKVEAKESKESATDWAAVVPGVPDHVESDAHATHVSRTSARPSQASRGSGVESPPRTARGRARVSRISWLSAASAQSRGTLRTAHTGKSKATAVSKATFATNVTKMTQATFHSYALAQVDAPATSILQTALPLLPEPSEEGGETPAVRIPSYIILPLLATLLASFAGMFALSMSTLVAAVVFQDRFGLNAAVSGALRSAGGVAAVVGMALMPAGASDEDRFSRGMAWRLLATVLCKPYKLSFVVALWGILSVGMATPNIFVAATAQVFMGVAMALTNRAVSEMCLFFCLGDGGIFLKMQVRRSLSDAFGGGLACLLGPIIYDIFGAEGPFFTGAALALVVFLFYVIAFCRRVGWGRSLEDAEAARARRRGTKRQSLWKTKSKSRITQAIQEDEET